MDFLSKLADRYGCDKGLSSHRYTPIYHELFKDLKIGKVLEIGVEAGKSLLMWRDYFGCNTEIVGIDINPVCKQHERDGIRVYIGDVKDLEFIQNIHKAEGLFDIVVDDGSHKGIEQIAAFNFFFNTVKLGGWYIIEDVWDGEARGRDFINYLFGLVKKMNHFCSDRIKIIEYIKIYEELVIIKRAGLGSIG